MRRGSARPDQELLSESTLAAEGIPRSEADSVAHAVTHAGGGDSSSFAEHGGHRAQEIFSEIQLDFAFSSRTVFYVMAGVMAVAFLVALLGMPGGKAPDRLSEDPEPDGAGV